MDDSVQTAQLATVLAVERKRFENDQQRGLLPVEAGSGTGYHLRWTREDAFRIALFYLLRDHFGLAPRPAAALAAAEDAARRFEPGRTILAVYRHQGTFHLEALPEQVSTADEGGFDVFPGPEDAGAVAVNVPAVMMIDAGRLDREIAERWIRIGG